MLMLQDTTGALRAWGAASFLLFSAAARHTTIAHFFTMIRSTMLLLSTALCAAQSSCPAAEPSSSVTLAVASGYSAHQIKADLSRPRSVVVDDRGQLLISGSKEGVVGLALDRDGCSVQRKAVVVAGNDKVCWWHSLRARLRASVTHARKR